MTSENGKLVVLTSGGRKFQQHAKHAEGGDTAPASHTRKTMSAGCTNPDFDKSEKITQPSGAATPSGQRHAWAHRCPEGFLRSSRAPPGQDPKAAKFAVLTPGPGMFVNVRNAPRVVIAALSGRPLFRRVSRCVRSCWRRRVCTRFHPQKQTWTVLQAIATRTFLPRGTH